MRNKINKLKDEANIRNPSRKTVPVVGTIDDLVQTGTNMEFVSFFIADKLATSAILRCDICDLHVDCSPTFGTEHKHAAPGSPMFFLEENPDVPEKAKQ